MTRRSPAEYDFAALKFDDRLISKNFNVTSGRTIKAIVAHHMVIRDQDPDEPDALDAMARVWQGTETSAHYGVDGRFVGQFVNDKDIAWAVGNWAGNQETISIEHTNSTLDEPGSANDYHVSDETWRTGARLAGNLHKVYGLGRPVMNVTLRQHNTYSSTMCPGPYLGGIIWPLYCAEAQRVYDGAPEPTPIPEEPEKEEVDMFLVFDGRYGVFWAIPSNLTTKAMIHPNDRGAVAQGWEAQGVKWLGPMAFSADTLDRIPDVSAQEVITVSGTVVTDMVGDDKGNA